METDMVECYFCGERKHIEAAIADGWEPMFWETDTTHVDQPTCPLCAAKFLTTDPESDELVRKPWPRLVAESDATQRLAAAAPALLEACEAALDLLSHSYDTPSQAAIPQLRAAIAAAKGGEA